MSYVLNFVATLLRPETEAGEEKKNLQPSLLIWPEKREAEACLYVDFFILLAKDIWKKKPTKPDFSDTIFELAIISTNLFRAEERWAILLQGMQQLSQEKTTILFY